MPRAGNNRYRDNKRWILSAADEQKSGELAAALNVCAPVARSLVARGYEDPSSAAAFLRPSLANIRNPAYLPGMVEAVRRLVQALQRKERIVVFGDYDADGVTSTALVVRVLRELGGDVHAFLPHRVDDGYGLSAEALARCVEQLSPKLVVTVDCGTSAVESVKWAATRGVDVIVTDHHLPGPELAPACALINPKLGADPAERDLAGVGVAFKLCYAVARETHGMTAHALQRHLDLVAVGTIADVVPLVGENRILAWHGLKALADNPCAGLAALCRICGVEGAVSAWHVGFVLGPRLNAVGRLDSAQAALDLLLSEDVTECARLASDLDAANRERQSLEQNILQQATEMWDAQFDPARDFGLVASGSGWHPGVIGIVAARLCQRYYRPAIVIALPDQTDEWARGSCRSIEGFNMVAHLQKCADLLERYGGHAMAAGLDIPAERIEEFRRRFNDVCRETLYGADLRPPVRCDAVVALRDVSLKLIEDARSFEPCGVGNPKPRWAAFGVRSLAPPRVVKKEHIQLVLGDGESTFRSVGFNMAGRALPDGLWDIVFELILNNFRGDSRIELQLVDFRAHSGDISSRP